MGRGGGHKDVGCCLLASSCMEAGPGSRVCTGQGQGRAAGVRPAWTMKP
uniref:Uncharacterized protein n=1 Tax=Macaca fascicularis TaxID=9541 RepID=A0A7N9IGS1_MACFA